MPTVITPDQNNQVQLPDRRVSDPNFDQDFPPPPEATFVFTDVYIDQLTRNGVLVLLDPTLGTGRRPGWLTTYTEIRTHNEYQPGEGVRWNLVAQYPLFDFELVRPPNPGDEDIYTLAYEAAVSHEGEVVRTVTCTWTLTVREITS